MKHYLPILLICFWLALAPAIGVSAPRHWGRIGRLLAATSASAAAGSLAGFTSVLAVMWWHDQAGGNNAQAGVAYLMVMVVVSLLTSYLVARAFRAAP